MAESTGGTAAGAAPAEQHTVAETELKAGAIGLPGVLMIGVTAIAPAIAGMFTIPFWISHCSAIVSSSQPSSALFSPSWHSSLSASCCHSTWRNCAASMPRVPGCY